MSKQAWAVTAGDEGARLDKFLADRDRLGSRSKATTAIDRGKIFVNDREAAIADAALTLAAGDIVSVWMDRPGSGRAVHARPRRDGALVVIYEDASLLVVDKPPGLLAVPLRRRGHTESLIDLVDAHLRSQSNRRPLVVHRIDRDTSGLVMFAKDGTALAHLKAQFLRREPERVYLAVVHGHPTPDAGTWRDRLVWDGEELIQRATSPKDPRGKEAVSTYRVAERLRGASLVEVSLVTGKRNQIRLQAELRGHPLVGEKMYADTPVLRRISFPRQALHAWKLAFEHPVTGRALRLESPVPRDLSELLSRLRATPPTRRAPG